jgi:hypothetical protein
MAAICDMSKGTSDSEWLEICNMLHALKGDLSALIPEEIIGSIVSQIENFMTSNSFPREFARKWRVVQNDLECVFACSSS